MSYASERMPAGWSGLSMSTEGCSVSKIMKEHSSKIQLFLYVPM